MKKDITTEPSFREVVSLIQKAKQKALATVNKHLINLYWQVGEYISKKVESEDWGKSVVEKLANHIRENIPDSKGFSSQNLWRMKQFYEIYTGNEKLSPMLRELSWTNNMMILGKCKSAEERKFYIKLALKERYTSRELEKQINSSLFQRFLISDQKLSALLRELHKKDLPQKYVEAHQQLNAVFKDTYIFDFLNLSKDYSESDLQKALVKNLRDFILEVGKDFALVGEEFRLQVGNHDYYLDLLLFHRGLQCLVVVELKIDEFKPEYLGKMNFYLETVDRQIKHPNENPSVGLILCASKDDEVVEYALSRNLSPTKIAEYKTKLIDKNILQRKLHELSEYARKLER
jgi:predicted nuclease of restriction endonuclease-like (RecB) superfamily